MFTGQPEPARSCLGLSVAQGDPRLRIFVPLAPSELPLPIFVPLASFARHRRALQANALARDGRQAVCERKPRSRSGEVRSKFRGHIEDILSTPGPITSPSLDRPRGGDER
jgi:hypothetical protein